MRKDDGAGKQNSIYVIDEVNENVQNHARLR